MYIFAWALYILVIKSPVSFSYDLLWDREHHPNIERTHTHTHPRWKLLRSLGIMIINKDNGLEARKKAWLTKRFQIGHLTHLSDHGVQLQIVIEFCHLGVNFNAKSCRSVTKRWSQKNNTTKKTWNPKNTRITSAIVFNMFNFTLSEEKDISKELVRQYAMPNFFHGPNLQPKVKWAMSFYTLKVKTSAEYMRIHWDIEFLSHITTPTFSVVVCFWCPVGIWILPSLKLT